MGIRVPEDDQLRMVNLLEAGIPISRVADRTGWSEPTVRKVQREHGLTARRRGERDIAPAVQFVVEEEEVAEEEAVAPWCPLPGFDPYAPRPHQDRWVAMLAAAGPAERDRMWQAIRSVIGVTQYASPEGIRRVLATDRRSADELARLYLAALEAL